MAGGHANIVLDGCASPFALVLSAVTVIRIIHHLQVLIRLYAEQTGADPM